MRDYLKRVRLLPAAEAGHRRGMPRRFAGHNRRANGSRSKKERDSAVNRLELSAIRQQIDWGNVFGNFGVMFREQVQPTIDRLKTIARSPVPILRRRRRDGSPVWLDFHPATVGDDVERGDFPANQRRPRLLSKRHAGLHGRAQREIEATEELARAKQTLKEAEGSGDARSIEAAELYVGEASKNLDKASQDVQMFGTQVQSTTTSLRESSEQAAGMFRNLESGLRNLSSGNLKGIGQGVMQLDKLFNGGKLTEKLGGSLAEGFEKNLRGQQRHPSPRGRLGQFGIGRLHYFRHTLHLGRIGDGGYQGVSSRG